MGAAGKTVYPPRFEERALVGSAPAPVLAGSAPRSAQRQQPPRETRGAAAAALPRRAASLSRANDSDSVHVCKWGARTASAGRARPDRDLKGALEKGDGRRSMRAALVPASHAWADPRGAHLAD